MIFISGRLEVDPDHIEEFVRAAQRIVEPTITEKGCNLYSFARDICQGNVLWVSEEWDTEEDLDAHLKSPHIREFLAGTSHLTLLSMDAKKYQISSVGPMEAPEG